MLTFKRGELWEEHHKGAIVCVTTNVGWDSETRDNNMGAGSVSQAAKVYPWLPVWYGAEMERIVEETGDRRGRVIYNAAIGVVFLPVKPLLDTENPERSWDQVACLMTIRSSLRQLRELKLCRQSHTGYVALTLPGAGNGGLRVEPVAALVRQELGKLRTHNYVVVDRQWVDK